MSPSRRDRRETIIWQRRFWEHTIRNEEDLAKNINGAQCAPYMN